MFYSFNLCYLCSIFIYSITCYRLPLLSTKLSHKNIKTTLNELIKIEVIEGNQVVDSQVVAEGLERVAFETKTLKIKV